jgi:hypothetical protein
MAPVQTRPRPPDQAHELDDALIEEARRRAKRRRRSYGAVVALMVLVGVGLYFGFGNNGGDGGELGPQTNHSPNNGEGQVTHAASSSPTPVHGSIPPIGLVSCRASGPVLHVEVSHLSCKTAGRTLSHWRGVLEHGPGQEALFKHSTPRLQGTRWRCWARFGRASVRSVCWSGPHVIVYEQAEP